MKPGNNPTTCDVVVIGGGDNGLLCAAYLAKAGAKTVLVNRINAANFVGNLGTDEFQGPYRFDLMPPYLLAMGERAPCQTDLRLEQHGVAYITPAVQIAFHHKGDRALVFHRDPERSAASIARFSAADAKRFLTMYSEFRELCDAILLPSLYAGDGDSGVAAQLGWTDLGKRLADLAARAPIEIVDGYGFENPAVREAILYLATFWGLDPKQRGVGQLAVLSVYSLLNSSLVKSGNVAVAEALYHSFLESGGESRANIRVTSILVENKKAVGVKLEDGQEIRARAVVSTLNPQETFIGLVGEQGLSGALAEACKAWEWQESCLFSCHFGYRGEAPAYRSAKFDPDSNQSYVHVFGVEESGDVEAIHNSIKKGAIPQNHGRAICTTQFDEFHAGFGHVQGPLQALRFETLVPWNLKGLSWEDAGEKRQQAALELWRRYADQVADGPISYHETNTPADLQRRLPSYKQGSFLGGKSTSARMGYGVTRPACSNYLSEIPGLYLGGTATPPGGVMLFAAGYNAAGLAVRDLKLKKWWDEPPNVKAARKNGYLPKIG